MKKSRSSSLEFCLHDPHSVLGLHKAHLEEENSFKIIRIWRPGAKEIYIELQGKLVAAIPVGKEGLFEVRVEDDVQPSDYRVYHSSGLLARDPYSYMPVFGEVDAHLFNKGVHYKLYEVLGAKVCVHEGCKGVKFAVWAPGAVSVALIADFNHWDGRYSPMRKMGESGVWEIFVPGLEVGEKYKFQINTKGGKQLIKADPLGFYSEVRPSTASIVFDLSTHSWQDDEWMTERATQSLDRPLNIYEVHLGSWQQKQGFSNYKDLAHLLADYVISMGFTHVELLPIAEHPLDESWGYQVTGFYAVTSRYGTPADFQYFVDHMHQKGIGVILDWVPAHFPSDDFSLAQFDGTCLYEHEDIRQGFHPHWNTNIFNYGRFEVSNFLIANALFWMDKMHIDGLRVDAVASMIYLDYGRNEGEWIPNKYGGKENLEALEFLKHLNSIVHEKYPKMLMIAEESTSFTGVTHPLPWGGLGFDLKWNMGWMNDTLRFCKIDPFFRHYDHEALTFGLIYAFSEQFMLVLSHDEVVHGKASLLSKMPGDDWQKFANLRLLYSYMLCQPGKKLLFMGGEVGQWSEWSAKKEVEWFLLAYPRHKGMQDCVKDLNHFYLNQSSLWEKDFEPTGFEWVSLADRQNSIIAYIRKGKRSKILCVHNFTPMYFDKYELSISNCKSILEVFCTDDEKYGGSGKHNRQTIQVEAGVATIAVAPLATMIFSITSV